MNVICSKTMPAVSRTSGAAKRCKKKAAIQNVNKLSSYFQKQVQDIDMQSKKSAREGGKSSCQHVGLCTVLREVETMTREFVVNGVSDIASRVGKPGFSGTRVTRLFSNPETRVCRRPKTRVFGFIFGQAYRVGIANILHLDARDKRKAQRLHLVLNIIRYCECRAPNKAIL